MSVRYYLLTLIGLFIDVDILKYSMTFADGLLVRNLLKWHSFTINKLCEILDENFHKFSS